jgi:nicotinamide mononucleotide (NMN) deamidase PncC
MEKPVGTVIVGIATPDDVRARELRFSGDRERLRTYGTAAALHLARLALIGRWWKE